MSAEPPHFAGGFAPCTSETDVERLAVSGKLPPWLRGTLYRNGPALWQVGSTTLAHWFDGMAKLHRFGFGGDGTVSFRCRMLQSEQYRVSLKRGKLWRRLFATEQPRRWWHKLMFAVHPTYGDNALVNIIPLAGSLAALTESPRVVRVDSATLEADGDLRFTDRIAGNNTTAHPLIDPRSGELINLSTKYGKVTQHQFTRLPAGSRQRELIGVLTTAEPSYHHSFGLSERFIVFTEFPFVVQPLRILFGSTTIHGSYRWKPELGLRVSLLERTTGQVFGPFTGEACFGFHHVNAWDREGVLTFDLALLDDHRIFDELLMERVRVNGFKIGPRLVRYRLDLASGTMRRESLGSGTFDFPMIDERQRCRPTTVVWGCGAADEQPDGMLNQLIRREVQASGVTTERRWYLPRCYPGEPVFVPRPTGPPNDGVLLSVVLDGCAQRSFLVVVDATTMTELARAELPLVVPFGFHGCFVPG